MPPDCILTNMNSDKYYAQSLSHGIRSRKIKQKSSQMPVRMASLEVAVTVPICRGRMCGLRGWGHLAHCHTGTVGKRLSTTSTPGPVAPSRVQRHSSGSLGASPSPAGGSPRPWATGVLSKGCLNLSYASLQDTVRIQMGTSILPPCPHDGLHPL